MAKTTLKAFEEALKADEALLARFEEALKGVTEAANDGEAVQKAAAQLGYELSMEDLEQAWAASQELDPTELEAVAGGQNEHSDWCIGSWFCFTVMKHTDVPDTGVGCAEPWARNNHTEACWGDYICWWAWEDDPR